MKRIVLGVVAAVFAVAAARSEAQPTTVPSSQTVALAASAATFDTFHDVPTGFVFVRLPQGWRFVGRDAVALSHPVFHDAQTDFTFVRVDGRWRYAGVAGDGVAMAADGSARATQVATAAR